MTVYGPLGQRASNGARTMSTRILGITVAAMLLPLAAAWGAEATSSQSDVSLFGKDPGNDRVFACYKRHYDADHLAAHPKQNVSDMTLLVDSQMELDAARSYLLTIGVLFRKHDHLFQVSGGCDSSVDGRNALNCGIDCDGGRIDVRVRDANSILVSIPDGAATWSGDDPEPPADARFGADDKSFRLERTDIADCRPLAWDDEARDLMGGNGTH